MGEVGKAMDVGEAYKYMSRLLTTLKICADVDADRPRRIGAWRAV